jgi:hypothetical protein
MKTAAGMISLFLVMPIWFYLLYKILESVGASELMWFLFWIYIPVNILVSLIVRLVED